ncbi:helix-turn-helix domain-containing protein [Ruegeria marisrubri]|uniref:helix-turn-helix domain-containing protein n=1 Tax=Ruegeria marisrubri TaxID=1685379 RepID=UPI001CD76801|nr:helix-turn-helix domain-containing protein [Ruegeria marisrubri]MCA0905159.1 helix-turn-helix domain-containing protein [Ruegeria marisrubri]
MNVENHDWRGEHLIRCQRPEEEPESDTRMNELDLRRKKVAKLINSNLTAPQIAERLGVSDSVVYKDAAKLKMKLTGAKAPGPKRKAA